MSSFHVDGRISLKLEYDFAIRLAEFILSTGTEDKQFVALGHKLLNLDEEEPNAMNPRFMKRNYLQQEKEIIRSAGRVLRDASDYSQRDASDYAQSQNSWEEFEKKVPIKVRTKYSKNI